MVTPDPKAGRFDTVARRLQEATVIAAALAGAALILPAPAGRVLATAALAVVVLVPIVRLAWLSLRWFRRGDTRFGRLPLAIIAVIGVGLVVGLA